MIGDFNVNMLEQVEKKTLLTTMCHQMGLAVFTTMMPTHDKSLIDFVIMDKSLKPKIEELSEVNISDHLPLRVTFTPNFPVQKGRIINLPNKKLAKKVTLEAIEVTKMRNGRAKSFLCAFDNLFQRNKDKLWITKRAKQYEKKLLAILTKTQEHDIRMVITEYYNQLWEDNESKRFSQDAKEAFDLLKRMSKYCLLYTSPSPRDGLLSRMPSSA